MARIYRVPYTGTLTASGGNADLLEVSPADDKPIALYGMRLGQTTEVGDVASEGLRITVQRFAATLTSGNGTSVTPVPNDSADAAAGFTAECNGATVSSTSGAATIAEEIGWNIIGTPLEIWWPDEPLQLKVKQGETLIVRCETTVADDLTLAMTFFIIEY